MAMLATQYTEQLLSHHLFHTFPHHPPFMNQICLNEGTCGEGAPVGLDPPAPLESHVWNGGGGTFPKGPTPFRLSFMNI